MNGRRLRSIENNENLCPLARKRVKAATTVTNRKITSDNATNSATKVENMGNGMLESDESSSSASILALAVSASGSCDENSNEATPNQLDAPKLFHHILQYQRTNLNYSIEALENSTDNAINSIDSKNSFETANKKLPAINNNNQYNKSSSGKINNSREDRYQNTERRLPSQRKVAILGAGAGLISSGNSQSPDSTTQNNGKCRSPLATVACNNNCTNPSSSIHENGNGESQISNTTTAFGENHNEVSKITPHCSKNCPIVIAAAAVNTSSSKQYFVPDENFFLYRNQSSHHPSSNGEDYFKKISDEMILHIFNWLPKKTLIRCSYVCQRFNRCARDESLWTRLDLGGRSLRPGSSSHILPRGIVILRLAQAELKHPIFDPEFVQMYPDYVTKLQYLDLSMAAITKPSLKMLLARCRQLKKLSLEHVPVNDEICGEIAKNINMETLNLAMCTGLEAWSVRKMLTELQNLNSLNISWTNLTVDAVSALVTNITPNLMRLNLSGCRKTMFDSHLATLSKRCTQLLELDLSDCTGLTSSAIGVICKFKMLEYLSLSRCYLISASSYMELKKLPTLTYLDVFGILSDTALEMLEKSFPSLGINKFIHSSVARPTVGTRRTSIWGLRTRD